MKSKKKNASKTSLLLSLTVAIVGIFGLVNLTNRKEPLIEFPSAANTTGDINLLRNPSYEIDSNNDKFPDNWSKSDNITREDVITQEESYSGKNSLRLILGRRKFYTQTFTGNWPTGTHFKFHAFSKGTNYLDLNHQPYFEVVFSFGSNTTDLYGATVAITPGNHEWKDNSSTWTNDRLYPVTKIRVRVGSEAAQRGNLYLDNVSVFAMTPSTTPTQMLTPIPTRRPTITPTRATCFVCDPLPGCFYPQATCTSCGPMVCSASPTSTVTQ
jgi:hypothetical protein